MTAARIGDTLAAEVGDRVALALHREARVPQAAVFERAKQAKDEARYQAWLRRHTIPGGPR